MSCNVYYQPHESTSPKFAAAYAKGCGGRLLVKYEAGDWHGFGSPLSWHELQASISAGYNFYFGDHAIGQRHKYYRITKNAYFTRGEGETQYKNYHKIGYEIKPWQRAGKYILICPQSETHYTLRFNTTRKAWLESTIAAISKHTDRPIKIHLKNDKVPLSTFLHDAHAVVVHSSNSAVEAIAAGVPAFCTADCPAYNMSLKDLSKIEAPLYPDDRERWLNALADNQWSLEEMAAGIAWRFLNA